MICVKLLGNDGYAGMRITCRGMRDMWWRDGDMRDMRDVIGRMRWGMMGGGYAGRTTSPKSGRGVCRFFGPPPPIHEERETRTANDLQAEKRMPILYLTC